MDELFPYDLYGGQQDNSAIRIQSRSMEDGIGERHWVSISGCESADPAFDRADPRYVYGGCYQGIVGERDAVTRRERSVMAWPYLGLSMAPRETRYRFNWNAPLLVSPHDPGLLYHAGNLVLATDDDAANRLAAATDQAETLLGRLGERPGADQIRTAGEALVERLDELDGALIQRRHGNFQDIINYPARLNGELAFLLGSVGSGPPLNAADPERFAELDARFSELMGEVEAALGGELAAFNALVDEHAVPAILPGEPQPVMPEGERAGRRDGR